MGQVYRDKVPITRKRRRAIVRSNPFVTEVSTAAADKTAEEIAAMNGGITKAYRECGVTSCGLCEKAERAPNKRRV